MSMNAFRIIPSVEQRCLAMRIKKRNLVASVRRHSLLNQEIEDEIVELEEELDKLICSFRGCVDDNYGDDPDGLMQEIRNLESSNVTLRSRNGELRRRRDSLKQILEEIQAIWAQDYRPPVSQSWIVQPGPTGADHALKGIQEKVCAMPSTTRPVKTPRSDEFLPRFTDMSRCKRLMRLATAWILCHLPVALVAAVIVAIILEKWLLPWNSIELISKATGIG